MAETAENVVKITKGMGFDDVIAGISTDRTVYLKVTNSQIDSIVEKSDRSCSLFLTKDKKIMLVPDITDISAGGIKETIKNASATLKTIKPKEDYHGIASPTKNVIGNFPYDANIENCDNATLADKATAAINGALSRGATSVAGMIAISSWTYSTASSNGFSNTSNGSFARMSLRVFKGKLSHQDVFASRMLNKVKFEDEAKAMTDRISDVKKIGKIENGKYDIIYMQSPGGSLMTNITAAACMSNAETGSCLTGKLNKEVADKGLIMYDDGRMHEGIQSTLYDSEGTPSQKTKLIGDGVLHTYLHNHSTAKKYKTVSTGNAGLIRPQPRTLMLDHKSKVKDVDAMISEVKNGILVTNSWYTRFSSFINGDFSTMPRDLTIFIKNGEPQYAIKQKDIGPIVGIRVSDNLIRMMKNMTLAANNTRQAASWDIDMEYFFVPSYLVKDATVTVV